MQSVHDKENDFQRGLATDLAPNWRDLAKADAATPGFLLAESSPSLGAAAIPAERYIDKAFHDREVDKVWKKTWQVVCREEEIPNVGDYFVYDVATLSFIVVRTAERSFKAFWNVCLHRGRKLTDASGCAATHFRCGYHAWTWDIHGKLVFYPGAWDFPDVTPEKFGLREVHCDTWGGFVFLNPDRTSKDLAEHLGPLREHFDRWPLDDRFTLWHVQKVIRSNWKVAMEAFLESYHVVQTHPQALPSVAEHSTQYDVFDNGTSAFSRLITPTAVPSKHAKQANARTAVGEAWALLNGLRADQADALPDDIIDRASLARWRRKSLAEITAADYSELSDAEMLDSIQYHLFPNFCPWYGEGLPLTYQFRPNADTPDTSFMDVWMLVRKPSDGAAPPAPSIVKLGPDEAFEPVIGAMGQIFDQDDVNMPKVQEGLRAWPDDLAGLTLARYQESRVRFFHKVLMRALDA